MFQSNAKTHNIVLVKCMILIVYDRVCTTKLCVYMYVIDLFGNSYIMKIMFTFLFSHKAGEG